MQLRKPKKLQKKEIYVKSLIMRKLSEFYNYNKHFKFSSNFSYVPQSFKEIDKISKQKNYLVVS